MTDFDPTDDDLVSAYLDNEVTTEEATAVEARPELLARVEELRSLQESLQAPIASTPRGAAMDDLIGAALGEFGSSNGADVHRFPTERTTAAAAQEISADADTSNDRPVRADSVADRKQTGVADLRAARERKNRRGMWLLSAAAAVLLAVAIPAALNNLGDDTDATSSTSADMALETASSASDDGAGDSADFAPADEATEEAATDAFKAESQMSVTQDDAQDSAAMAESASAPTIQTNASAGRADEDASAEDSTDDAEAADSAGPADVSGGVDNLGFFASTPTLDELVDLIEEPGFLDELEVVSQELGAPAIECAGEGETGGLANLTGEELVVEIILSPPEANAGVALVKVVERETCAELTTIER